MSGMDSSYPNDKSGYRNEPSYQTGYQVNQQPLNQPPPYYGQPIQQQQQQQQPVVVIMVPAGKTTPNKPNKCFLMMTLVIASFNILCSVLLICGQITLNVWPSALYLGETGIVVGVLGLVIGLLGIAAFRTKFTTKGITIALLVIGIITIIYTLALIIMAPIDILIVGLDEGDTYNRDYDTIYQVNLILTFGAVFELMFSIWMLVIASIRICCKSCCSQKDVLVQG